MRRRLTEEERIKKQLEALYTGYRIECRELREILAEQNQPTHGNKYHEGCEKLWKADYSTKVNTLHDRLLELSKEGA